MNAHPLMHNLRVLLGATVLLCAVLVVGCQDTDSIPVALEDGDRVVETSASKGKPGGGGAVFTVAMTGGLDAPLQVLDSFKENKRQISGNKDVLNVGLNLVNTQAYALAGNPNALPAGCSFTCDDAALANNPDPDADTCDEVYDILAGAFVSGIANHPSESTPGYTGLNIGFDKNAVNEEPALSSCPFTGIADFVPLAGGGVVIRNCHVTGNVPNKVFTVDTDPANTVLTAQRFDTDGNEGLGAQDYRATLVCPLMDAFTVTFAPEQP